MGTLTTFIKIIAVDLFSKTLKSAGAQTKQLTAAQKQAQNQARGLTMAMGAGMLLGAVTNLIRTAAQFEFALKRTAIIAGATGEQYKQLEERARTLGRETIYTSQQVAEGMQFLAMTGLTASQVITVIGSVTKLAAIGFIDLARAADITTNTMKAFGLVASDTSAVADAFGYAMTSANVTVEMIGESMKYVAPIARTAGQSIQETSAAIGLLGNVGIKGSMAGTRQPV